jgi:hypothetical protein
MFAEVVEIGADGRILAIILNTPFYSNFKRCETYEISAQEICFAEVSEWGSDLLQQLTQVLALPIPFNGCSPSGKHLRANCVTGAARSVLLRISEIDS